MRLGVRVQAPGGLSHHLAHELAIGAQVDTLAPTGRFVYRDGAGSGRVLLAVAAGSGITPILSIVTAALERDAASRVVLLYGNRSVAHTMFVEEIFALKNRFMDRFAAHFIMSREPQEMEIFNGRLDAAKLAALAGRLYAPARARRGLRLRAGRHGGRLPQGHGGAGRRGARALRALRDQRRGRRGAQRPRWRSRAASPP